MDLVEIDVILPRRRRLLSIEFMMCLRDSPRSFGSSLIGMYTFVATTKRSRPDSKSFNAWPRPLRFCRPNTCRRCRNS